MRILVTGGAGFIGTHLSKELDRNNHQAWRLDLRDAWERHPEQITTRTSLVLGDAFECMDESIARVAPDMVIHLAAKVGRLFGEDDVQRTINDNAAMTANVALACGAAGIPLVYASTSEVYGDCGDLTCIEDEPHLFPSSSLTTAGEFLPHNIYGLSKRWGEDVCRLYAPDDLTIWRISMPYGPGLPAGRGRAALINFLYNALHGLPITVHKDSERSWCWIGDTVRAMRLTIEKAHGGIWNLGRDDNALPMRTVAEMACDLTGASHDLIVEVAAPDRQTVVKRLSTRKIRSLGWEPEVDLEEGMRRTLEYVKALPAPAELQAA